MYLALCAVKRFDNNKKYLSKKDCQSYSAFVVYNAYQGFQNSLKMDKTLLLYTNISYLMMKVDGSMKFQTTDNFFTSTILKPPMS